MVDSSGVQFRGQLSESQYRAAQYLALRTIYFVWAAVLAALAANLVVKGYRPGLSHDPLLLLAMWVPLILPFPIVWWLNHLMLRWHWAKNKLLRQTAFGTVSEIGIEWNSEFIQSKVPWDAMLKAKMTKALVLVYTAPNATFYFPRSFFASEEEWVQFRSLVASRLPPRGWFRQSPTVT